MIPSQTKGARVRRFQWVSIGLLVLLGIVNLLDRSTLAIANHNISQELHFTKSQMVSAAFAFVAAFVYFILVREPIRDISSDELSPAVR